MDIEETTTKLIGIKRAVSMYSLRGVGSTAQNSLNWMRPSLLGAAESHLT